MAEGDNSFLKVRRCCLYEHITNPTRSRGVVLLLLSWNIKQPHLVHSTDWISVFAEGTVLKNKVYTSPPPPPHIFRKNEVLLKYEEMRGLRTGKHRFVCVCISDVPEVYSNMTGNVTLPLLPSFTRLSLSAVAVYQHLVWGTWRRTPGKYTEQESWKTPLFFLSGPIHASMSSLGRKLGVKEDIKIRIV